MNLADHGIEGLYQSVLAIDPSTLKQEIWKNHTGKLMVCLSGEYKNEYHTGEIVIHLKEGTIELSKENITSRNIQSKYIKKPEATFEINQSVVSDKFRVYQGKSHIYTGSKDLEYKYPRARNHNSAIEQGKAHKIVVSGTNALKRLLESPIS